MQHELVRHSWPGNHADCLVRAGQDKGSFFRCPRSTCDAIISEGMQNWLWQPAFGFVFPHRLVYDRSTTLLIDGAPDMFTHAARVNNTCKQQKKLSSAWGTAAKPYSCRPQDIRDHVWDLKRSSCGSSTQNKSWVDQRHSVLEAGGLASSASPQREAVPVRPGAAAELHNPDLSARRLVRDWDR